VKDVVAGRAVQLSRFVDVPAGRVLRSVCSRR
jgi:hypothetical protein